MNTIKLREALAEIESHAKVLEKAARSIRETIADIEGEKPEAENLEGLGFVDDAKRSYIDETVDLLRSTGAPIHAREITARISELRGSTVARASVESSIIRHIAKSNSPRLAKFGRAKYGLSEWKQEQKPALAQIA